MLNIPRHLFSNWGGMRQLVNKSHLLPLMERSQVTHVVAGNETGEGLRLETIKIADASSWITLEQDFIEIQSRDKGDWAALFMKLPTITQQSPFSGQTLQQHIFQNTLYHGTSESENSPFIMPKYVCCFLPAVTQR